MTAWCGIYTLCVSDDTGSATRFMWSNSSYSFINWVYSVFKSGFALSRRVKAVSFWTAIVRDSPISIGGPDLNGRRTMYFPSGAREWVDLKWFSHFCYSGDRIRLDGISSTSQNLLISLSNWQWNTLTARLCEPCVDTGSESSHSKCDLWAIGCLAGPLQISLKMMWPYKSAPIIISRIIWPGRIIIRKFEIFQMTPLVNILQAARIVLCERWQYEYHGKERRPGPISRGDIYESRGTTDPGVRTAHSEDCGKRSRSPQSQRLSEIFCYKRDFWALIQ